MKKKVTVFAPATVANLGCGFDSMGLAIASPGDELTLITNTIKEIRIRSITGDNKKLSLDPEKNTAGVAIKAMLNALEIKIGFDIYLKKKMPLGSGLGSSAASAVAGAFAVNELLGKPFSKKELIPFAMAGEKIASGAAHADNAAPCMLGGIVLVRSYNPFEVVSLPSPSKLFIVVVHPDVEVLTKNSRAVLPKKIPMKDAIAQWSNTAALVSGLYAADYGLIGRAVSDHVAEPYRAKLIPCFMEVKASAMRHGALGCSISGSGPSVFAFCEGKKSAETVSKVMQAEFRKKMIRNTAYISTVNQKGVMIVQ